MRAAVLREFKQPLSIEDVDQPQPGDQDVLIEVEACGVCHSDLHVADGDWPQIVPITKKPLILGHEIAGRVVEKARQSMTWKWVTAWASRGFTGAVGNATSAVKEMKTSAQNRKLPASRWMADMRNT